MIRLSVKQTHTNRSKAMNIATYNRITWLAAQGNKKAQHQLGDHLINTGDIKNGNFWLYKAQGGQSFTPESIK